MIKISKLEIENVKRVKAVMLEPAADGLTIIGGDNNQGKTSVLDAIAWALGGNKRKPSSAQREGSVVPPALQIVMSNGFVVERKGKNSDLKVTDPSGGKAGQALLDSFVSEFALDLPKFMASTSKEKGATLLKIIGVEDVLAQLEKQEAETYNKRLTIGQIADQKKKFALEQPYHNDAPDEPIVVTDLIKQQQAISTRNYENQLARRRVTEAMQRKDRLFDECAALEKQIKALTEKFEAMQAEYNQMLADVLEQDKAVSELKDESTAAIEEQITNAEGINAKVRQNLHKNQAEDDAKSYADQYDMLSNELKDIRKEKMDLLNNAKLPLPGLSVEDSELTYNGFRWDGMSGSDQLKVATAIVRQLNPECGFVLLDKLEQMDMKTLKEFGQWLETEGLQAIATRVSTGEECQIIIEDGYAVTSKKDKAPAAKEPEEPKWKAGKF